MALTQIFALIGTGLSLGVVHVLTGPDHLSAIATLSANVNAWQAFNLGVRWGLGHSTGLLLVGCVFIVASVGSNDTTISVPEHVSHAFEGLVGFFMLLLGFYGMRKAWEKRPTHGSSSSNSNSSLPLVDYRTILDNDVDVNGINALASVVDECAMENHDDEEHAVQNKENSSCQQDVTDEEPQQSTLLPPADSADASSETERPMVDETNEVHDDETDDNPLVVMHCLKSLSLRTMATAAGIVHGLAGPGGVLGVIPAVQLHSARLATIYLASFCASSTLTMGLFAMLYGTCSSNIGSGGHRRRDAPYREFLIEGMSASLSLLVGMTWLILLSIGKLDDVFP